MITSDVPGRMAAWPGWDIELVWLWPITREGEARHVCVGVVARVGKCEDVAEESRRVIETLGRSAVMAVLDRDDPPRRITVASTGLREEDDERRLLRSARQH